MMYHEPVMLKETLEFLNPGPGKRYIDCTLGDGGHTLALLKTGAHVLGFEVYADALARATQRIQNENLQDNFVGINQNFKNLEKVAIENNFAKVDGILFDLGYSSYQLDETQIGLSFKQETPLDMRLDTTLGVTAADLVNKLPQDQLAKIIRSYGGEKMAKKISTRIVESREKKKFQTTKDLADLIVSATPSSYENGRIHPATRTFQALRIAVNDELNNFRIALPQAARVLLPGGRVVCITFHSLEDKIAKTFGKSAQPKLQVVTKKPIAVGEQEAKQNKRARSAKIRVYEQL